MSGNIESYKDLLERQKQLKALLRAKKELISSDIELLKIATKPASDLLGSLSNTGRRRLLAIGIGLAARRLVRKLVLMRTPWVARMVLQHLDEHSRLKIKDFMKRFTRKASSIVKENPIEATRHAGQSDNDNTA